jgi:hypothetical protein
LGVYEVVLFLNIQKTWLNCCFLDVKQQSINTTSNTSWYILFLHIAR